MARKLQQRQQGIRGRGQQKAKGWLASKMLRVEGGILAAK